MGEPQLQTKLKLNEKPERGEPKTHYKDESEFVSFPSYKVPLLSKTFPKTLFKISMTFIWQIFVSK